MPLSRDVILHKIQKPKFPDQCVLCQMEHPDSTYCAYSYEQKSWLRRLFSKNELTYSIEIPACSSCKEHIHRQWWFRVCVFAIFIVAGMAAGFYLLQWYKGPFRKWFIGGIVLLFIIPVFLWETIWPKVINVNIRPDKVIYEFQNHEYAEKFLELNQSDLFGENQILK